MAKKNTFFNHIYVQYGCLSFNEIDLIFYIAMCRDGHDKPPVSEEDFLKRFENKKVVYYDADGGHHAVLVSNSEYKKIEEKIMGKGHPPQLEMQLSLYREQLAS